MEFKTVYEMFFCFIFICVAHSISKLVNYYLDGWSVKTSTHQLNENS